ncbi:MAG: Uncharacterized MFS-type transporter, partial [uncultured Actinomycetospora sp.]
APGDRVGLGAGDAGRDGGQRRPGADRHRSGRQFLRAAVDDQRVHADAGRADPAGWVVGRPLRPAADFPRGRGVVRGRVAAVRGGPDGGVADRRPRAAGSGWSAAHAGQPGHHLGVVPRHRPGRRCGRVVRAGWGGRGRGALRGRLAGRVELAGGVPDQRADRRRDRARRAAPRAREPRPAGRAAPRPPRHRIGRAGAGCPDLGTDRRRRARPQPARGGRRDGRGRGAGAVRARRAALDPPAGARGPVRERPLHRHQRGHAAGVRGDGGAVPASGAAAAGGRRLQPTGRRDGAAAGDRVDVGSLSPGRAVGHPHRAADPDHGWAAGRGGGPVADAADRRPGLLLVRRAACGDRVRARALGHGRSADRDGPRLRRGPSCRGRLRGQQRHRPCRRPAGGRGDPGGGRAGRRRLPGPGRSRRRVPHGDRALRAAARGRSAGGSRPDRRAPRRIRRREDPRAGRPGEPRIGGARAGVDRRRRARHRRTVTRARGAGPGCERPTLFRRRTAPPSPQRPRRSRRGHCHRQAPSDPRARGSL